MGYILLQTLIWFKMPFTNKMGMLMGGYMSILPMMGFFLSRFISFDDFVKVIMRVAFVHAVIGILLYPVFGFTILPPFISEVLLEGVMIGRMSSVSGSLGFGCMLMVTSICAFYYKKHLFFLLFILCVIFSLQRSAWLATIFGLLLYMVYEMKKRKNLFVFKYLLVGGIVILVMMQFVDNLGISFEYVTDKFQSIGSAANERSGLWLSGIENFKSYPLGTGVGQVGQVARFESTSFLSVPDGDYFRILSEFGISFFFFYLPLMLFIISLLFHSSVLDKRELCVLSIVIGFSFQMIGSNVTEFYYNNLIYWMAVGYLFAVVDRHIIFQK